MLAIVTPPTEYPISLAEVRQKLRLAASGDVVTAQTIAIGGHSVSVTGSTVDSTGYTAIGMLDVGLVNTGEDITATIQHSIDSVTWEDANSFAVVTPSNDLDSIDLPYTGDRPYLRIRAVITGAPIFGAQFVLSPILTDEDDQHTRLIDSATDWAQNFLRSQFVEATRVYKFRRFPLYSDRDYKTPGVIEVPWGNVLTIESVKYIDTNGDQQTIDPADYVVEIAAEPVQIWPAYGTVWPSTRDQPNAVEIKFTCGYGDASDVPGGLKQALLSHVAFHAMHDGDDAAETPAYLQNLLSPYEWDGRIVRTPEHAA